MITILLASSIVLSAVSIVVLFILLSRQTATRHLAQDVLAAQAATQTNVYKHVQSVTANLAAAEKNLREATAAVRDNEVKLADDVRTSVAETLKQALQMVSGQLVELKESQQ